MQVKAHHLLILLPLLVPGCSTQFELSTEKRSPSETTESVEKFETKVGVEILSDREEPSDRDPVRLGDQSPTIKIEGDGNFAIVVEGDLVSDPDQRPSPPTTKKPTWNTKIPWPTQLRGASSWSLNCYLAVWALLIGSIALMLHTANRREEGGPLWIIVAMLGAAAILLQFLPCSDSGIQLIPLSPWSYVGWESFFVSLGCWMAIVGAVYVVVDRMVDSPKAFAVLVLIAMGLNLGLSWSAVG